MMTHELEVSILAAPLAAMDRRALSQAWYSALHLAQGSSAPQTCAFQTTPRTGAQLRTIASRNLGVEFDDRATPLQPAASRRDARASCDAAQAASSTSRRCSRLSRSIELRFAATSLPVTQATFSFGRGSARVIVMMQTNGNTARLVAICRPAMRDVVARALAEARLALCARGITIALRTKQCS
jgi:hypothetical protein